MKRKLKPIEKKWTRWRRKCLLQFFALFVIFVINEIFVHFAVFLEGNNHFEILHSVFMDSTKPASINRQTGRLITTSLALFLQLRTREINDFDPIFFLYFMAAYIVLLSGWQNDIAQMISQSKFPSLYLRVVRFHQIIKAIRKNIYSLTLLLTFFSKIDVDVFSSLVIDMIANDS